MDKSSEKGLSAAADNSSSKNRELWIIREGSFEVSV